MGTLKLQSNSDRTDLSTESGSGLIQLARARHRTACRSVTESPLHCMNAPQHVHGPLSSAMKLGLLGGGRSLTDRRTGGGDARFPNGDVDRNSISIVS